MRKKAVHGAEGDLGVSGHYIEEIKIHLRSGGSGSRIEEVRIAVSGGETSKMSPDGEGCGGVSPQLFSALRGRSCILTDTLERVYSTNKTQATLLSNLTAHTAAAVAAPAAAIPTATRVAGSSTHPTAYAIQFQPSQ